MSDVIAPKKFYITLERDPNGEFESCASSPNHPLSEEKSKEDTTETEEKKDPPAPEGEFDFKSVIAAFVSNMNGYRNFIPLTVGIGSTVAYQGGFKSIHKLAEEKGNPLAECSSDSTLAFELDIEHYREYSVLSERMDVAINGAKELPKIMLIGLVSAYDAMLGRLLAVVFKKHEEIVFTTEKTLKFSDLLAYGSIEAAKSALVDKEIETILRESHHAQFSIMENKFSVRLREDLPIWPTFVEACERRNLITHTGGIVSNQYIASGRENKFDVSGTTVGQQLDVNSQYYGMAVNAVYEVGVKLCHVFWRKFSPDQRETADNALNELGFSLIRDRNYKLAEAILGFGVRLKKHHSDKIRRMMVVNLANSIRLQKRQEEANAVLGNEDWSAVGKDFAICVAAVKNDVEEVTRLMKEMGVDGPLDADNYRSWPVFRGLGTNEKFQTAFEKTFGKKLIAPKKSLVENVRALELQITPVENKI